MSLIFCRSSSYSRRLNSADCNSKARSLASISSGALLSESGIRPRPASRGRTQFGSAPHDEHRRSKTGHRRFQSTKQHCDDSWRVSFPRMGNTLVLKPRRTRGQKPGPARTVIGRSSSAVADFSGGGRRRISPIRLPLILPHPPLATVDSRRQPTRRPGVPFGPVMPARGRPGRDPRGLRLVAGAAGGALQWPRDRHRSLFPPPAE